MSAPINVESLFSVKGLVALVTGGGTGIGLMMAKALADGGAAKVYIVGRRTEVLQAAAASIGKPTVVVPLYCDVTSKVSLESVADVIANDAGYLNLLVCNAGVSGPYVVSPTAGESAKDWAARSLAHGVDEYTDTFRLNTVSVWYTAMACLDLLDRGNKKGNMGWSSQVVVTSSIAGFNKKSTGGFAYGQSKAAATHLVKQLSVVLPTWGMRANAILPGLFPSDMSAPLMELAGADPNQKHEVIPVNKSAVPEGRMGDDLDMAGQILYLASKAGSYLNGNIIICDGGRLTTFPTTF